MRSRPYAFRSALLGLVSVIGLAAAAIPADAANKVLKIGFVGVTSGPAAAWGTSNVRSMETLADWWNSTGGVKIGDDTYDIDVVTFDDQKDAKRAIAGMEKMAQEGIHYVVGPNVDDGAAAVRPVAEKSGIIYFPYAFPKELYTKPASNAVLGMVASYQSGPAIYKYLKENKGVKTVAFVAANKSDPLSQRDSGVAAAKALGLDVVADKDTYQNDTRDFTPVLTPIVKLNPDLLVLSGVAPANAPLLIRSARGASASRASSRPKPRRTPRCSRKARATSPTASSRSAASQFRPSARRRWKSSSTATPSSASTTTSRTPRSMRCNISSTRSRPIRRRSATSRNSRRPWTPSPLRILI